MSKIDQKSKLDQFALDIEFLLISIIQGLALSVLAAYTIDPIKNLQFEYWPYIAASFLLLLLFWTQAIIHAFSFITWPISLPHTFMYFLIGFIEVIAFTQITKPFEYFFAITIFSIVTLLIYFLDLHLMQQFRHKTNLSPARQKLTNIMIEEHKYELKTLVPFGIFLNTAITYAIYTFHPFLIDQKMHIYLITIQAIVFLQILLFVNNSYKKRAHLLAE